MPTLNLFNEWLGEPQNPLQIRRIPIEGREPLTHPKYYLSIGPCDQVPFPAGIHYVVLNVYDADVGCEVNYNLPIKYHSSIKSFMTMLVDKAPELATALCNRDFYSVEDYLRISIDEESHGGYVGSSRYVFLNRNKTFTRLTGQTPSNLFYSYKRAVNMTLKVGYWTRKYGYRFLPGSRRAEPNTRMWMRIKAAEKTLEKTMSHVDVHHLAPLVILFNADISELRRMFGRGLWKRITKMSHNRILALTNYLDPGSLRHNFNADEDFPDYWWPSSWDKATSPEERAAAVKNFRHVVDELMNYPSTLLVGLKPGPHEVRFIIKMSFAGFGWEYFKGLGSTYKACLASINAHRVEYLDTVDMARRLGLLGDIKPSMTHSMWTVLHRRFTTELRKRQALEKSIPFSLPPHVAIEVADGHIYQARLLLSPRELQIEGKAMHHCVGSYDNKVRQGQSLLYSVCVDGQRASTLELTTGTSLATQWMVNQNRGPCNGRVSAELLKFAQAVCKSADRAIPVKHMAQARMYQRIVHAPMVDDHQVMNHHPVPVVDDHQVMNHHRVPVEVQQDADRDIPF